MLSVQFCSHVSVKSDETYTKKVAHLDPTATSRHIVNHACAYR